MNKLKEFYEEAEKREDMKKALLQANEDVKGLSEEEVKEKIIALGNQFGFEISKEDFNSEEGEMDENAIEKVAGGIKAGCFFSNAGCTVLGEIDGSGGCILLGLY